MLPLIAPIIVTSAYKLALQEIKVNWEDNPPVKEPGDKEQMGDLFTNTILQNDSKL